MRHSISLECVRYRLRPVTLDDAPFIVELRKDPILSRYVHEISTRVEDQISWPKGISNGLTTTILLSKTRIRGNRTAQLVSTISIRAPALRGADGY